MKRKITIVLILLICMIFVSSCEKSEIKRFSMAKVDSTYQTDIYSNYTNAILKYYNEVISLCNNLVDNDYTTLIKSTLLDLYKNAVDTEHSSIYQNPGITKEEKLIHLRTHQKFLLTAYYIAVYNANHVEIRYYNGILIEKGQKGDSIDDYYRVVESIENMRETLYS